MIARIQGGEPWFFNVFYQSGPIKEAIRIKLNELTGKSNGMLCYEAFSWSEAPGFENPWDGKPSITFGTYNVPYHDLLEYFDKAEKILEESL